MALFDRVAAALFGAKAGSADTAAERKLVAEMTEAVVDAVEPRVRLHSRYREKLDQPVRQAIGYLRELGRQPLEPVPLSRAAWASDPRVNAFFGTADSVAACLGRSPELRSFFDKAENAGVPEAYALLGMKKEERNVLGMELKGDAVQRDVAQVQVSFSGHRIVAPAATQAAARLEIGRRILLRLAQVALARIVAAESKATELAQVADGRPDRLVELLAISRMQPHARLDRVDDRLGHLGDELALGSGVGRFGLVAEERCRDPVEERHA